MDVFLSEGIEVLSSSFKKASSSKHHHHHHEPHVHHHHHDQVIFRLSLALLLRARAELLHHDMEGVLTYFQVILIIVIIIIIIIIIMIWKAFSPLFALSSSSLF